VKEILNETYNKIEEKINERAKAVSTNEIDEFK
jgi:hypothetical protein